MPQCYQSIVINAPIDEVWRTVRHFHEWSWAPHIIRRCEAVGSLPGDQVGAQRIINEEFHETLLECNPTAYRIRYSMDEGPSPVSSKDVKHYIGSLQLRPITSDASTFVEWRSTWVSDTDAALEFCHTLYLRLLRALARHLETA